MNIFALHLDPKVCAQMHVDKHVVKMILEYSQLLSTAHRVLDGKEGIDASSGRRIKRWKLDNSISDNLLYKATHVNHPSAIWARESKANYQWLASLLVELCNEYTYRYGKVHKCEEIGLVKWFVQNVPKNISNKPFAQPTPAMPEQYKVKGDSVKSYRNYYVGDKQRMASWKSRQVPEWWV